MAAGDFNGDGKPDLLTDESNGDLGLYLGNGDGTFAPPITSIAGARAKYSNVMPLAVGDFNGDGKPDAAVITSTSLTILGNQGNGTFKQTASYSGSFVPNSISIGDFNNDGKLDIAMSTNVSTVVVMLGNGNGTFAPAVNYAGAVNSGEIALGDFNGDGNLDIAEYGSDSVNIFLGNGNAAPFAQALLLIFPLPISPVS